jgi:hypothetical protein
VFHDEFSDAEEEELRFDSETVQTQSEVTSLEVLSSKFQEFDDKLSEVLSRLKLTKENENDDSDQLQDGMKCVYFGAKLVQ